MDYSDYDFSRVPHTDKPHHTSATATDIETSSLHPFDMPDNKGGVSRKGGIVELAGLSHDYMGNERGRFSTLVNPGDVDYNPKAMETNGISMADIAKAPSIKDVLPSYVDWLKQMHEDKPWQSKDGRTNYTPATHIVGHNHQSFDLPFIARSIEEHHPKLLTDFKKLIRQPWDTMQNGSHYMAQPGLASEGKRFGIGNPNPHRAMGDVEQTMGIYHQQRGRQRLMENLMAQGGVDIPRKTHDGQPDSAQRQMFAGKNIPIKWIT